MKSSRSLLQSQANVRFKFRKKGIPGKDALDEIRAAISGHLTDFTHTAEKVAASVRDRDAGSGKE